MFLKRHSSRDIRFHFFSERVINRWNCLPSNAVEATSVNSFKLKLDKVRKTQISFFMDTGSVWRAVLSSEIVSMIEGDRPGKRPSKWSFFTEERYKLHRVTLFHRFTKPFPTFSCLSTSSSTSDNRDSRKHYYFIILHDYVSAAYSATKAWCFAFPSRLFYSKLFIKKTFNPVSWKLNKVSLYQKNNNLSALYLNTIIIA